MKLLSSSPHYRGNDENPATLAHAKIIQHKATGPALSPLDLIPALAAVAELVADPAVSVPEAPGVAVVAAKPTRLVGSGHLSKLSVEIASLLTTVGLNQ